MISEKLSTDSRRMLQNGVPQFVGFCRCTPCRQRRGKEVDTVRVDQNGGMHPVQAAPRQRGLYLIDGLQAGMHPVQAAPRQSRPPAHLCQRQLDAPRAGSAEAKIDCVMRLPVVARCTPCRQRRGKDDSAVQTAETIARCTPCRQRRGKAEEPPVSGVVHGCTPCRQRTAK